MPPADVSPSQDDKVWISREEYERLRTNGSISPGYGTPVVYTGQAGAEPLPPPDRQMGQTMQVVGLVAALALLLSFTTSMFDWLVVPAVLFLAGLAIISIWNVARSGRIAQPSKVTKYALAALGIILFLPILGYMAMIFLFILIFSFGGGDVGS